MPVKYTKENFVQRSNLIHNNLYNYSKVNYKNMHTKVCIIDPDYGEFWQVPMGHINGQGHPIRGRKKSSDKRKLGKEEFIKRAVKKHGNLYCYSKVNYTHIDHKVCIIDPDYGEFWQSPYQHLNSHGNPLRTSKKEWLVHIDHIIPLSIIHPGNRSPDKWFKKRPLYKFLDSDVNKQKISSIKNLKKSDIVIINGKKIYCNSVRNNYDVIYFLIKHKLNIDASEIINQDREFIKNTFNL
jgi:hypothetical protein